MSRSNSQYSFQPWLTPVRVVSTSDQSGTYFNGNGNNGVGATFTYATGVLTIDGVDVQIGDRVLLTAQTNAFQNGIYVCNTTGAVGVAAVLQRSNDQQSIEQMRTGFYVSVGAGNSKAGSMYTMVEPLPGAIGIDAILWNSVESPIQLNKPIVKVITLTAAALAAGALVSVQAAVSTTSQFLVEDIKVLKSTGLSGGGGDRLLQLSDGTLSFNNAGITAALLGTPILTLWGGTGNPIGVATSAFSTAGADISFKYAGGTTDYTTGSVQVAVTLVPVTA